MVGPPGKPRQRRLRRLQHLQYRVPPLLGCVRSRSRGHGLPYHQDQDLWRKPHLVHLHQLLHKLHKLSMLLVRARQNAEDEHPDMKIKPQGL